MAEEVDMTPVEAAEPPKADPLAKPAAKIPTVEASPVPHNPTLGGSPTATLKPGLKLPPKPGSTVALKPGLKLPPKPAGMAPGSLKPGLNLPAKPAGMAPGGLKPGLNLPAKPAGMAPGGLKPGLKMPTQTSLKPGVNLPPRPVIHKPGATVTAMPLPKPVTPPVASAAEPAAPEPAPAAKPVAVDAQGVGKLPTVEAKAVDRDNTSPAASEIPKPLEALKSITQKLKGITQEIPQQAILRKTGIIADAAMTEAQKEAAKHKTARISLSDAMGVAPVKNENAPMKTIKIKRPEGIPGATVPLSPQPNPEAAAAADAPAGEAAATVTQRKTLKIARPGGGAIRPGGKFGIKRPGLAAGGSEADVTSAPGGGAPAEGGLADIGEIPNLPMAPVPFAAKAVDNGPAWLWTLSAIVQIAACLAMGLLSWYLYQNSVTAYF